MHCNGLAIGVAIDPAGLAFGWLPRMLLCLAHMVVFEYLCTAQEVPVDDADLMDISIVSTVPQAYLLAIGDRVYFATTSMDQSNKNELPAFPAADRTFLKTEEFLQVYISAESRFARGDRHRWYLSGDYTVEPPRVILTKEPTENSRWQFDSNTQQPWSRVRLSSLQYLRNVNMLGKPAWAVPSSEFRRVTIDGRVVELSEIVLSFDRKQALEIATRAARRNDGGK